MEATARRQRRKSPRKPACSSLIHLEIKEGAGTPRWVTADLADVIDGGCGLMLMTVLRPGSTVIVRGKFGGSHTAEHLKAVVRWCIGKPDGTFRAGLEFLSSHTTFKLDEQQVGRGHLLDCYEVMQLSPNADAETISRVYRMLASRYHPDNAATGNSEKFIRLCEAHEILSDPAKRASYDARYRAAMQLRWRAGSGQATASGESEERERRRFDRVRDEGTASRGGRRREGNLAPSPGALRGWSAALGYPTS